MCFSGKYFGLSIVCGYFHRKIFKGKCIVMVNYIEKLGWGMGKKAKVTYKQKKQKPHFAKFYSIIHIFFALAAPLMSDAHTEQTIRCKAWLCMDFPTDWLCNRVVYLRGFPGVKEGARPRVACPRGAKRAWGFPGWSWPVASVPSWMQIMVGIVLVVFFGNLWRKF